MHDLVDKTLINYFFHIYAVTSYSNHHYQILSSLQQIHLKYVKDIFEQIIMNELEKNNSYCKKSFMPLKYGCHSDQKIMKKMQPIPRAKVTMTELLLLYNGCFSTNSPK